MPRHPVKRKRRHRQEAQRARGPYRRDLDGPVRYVRLSASIDDEVLKVYPGRTASDAYRAALAAWVKLREYLRTNPPNNPELDSLLETVIP